MSRAPCAELCLGITGTALQIHGKQHIESGKHLLQGPFLGKCDSQTSFLVPKIVIASRIPPRPISEAEACRSSAVRFDA